MKDIKEGDYSSNTEENDENIATSKEDGYEHGKHPNSLKAIKKHQFKKGQSGNPQGLQANHNFKKMAEQLKKLGQEDYIDYFGKNFGKRKDVVYDTIWNGAIKGNIKMIELLATLGCLD